jgi:hypothetical protein
MTTGIYGHGGGRRLDDVRDTEVGGEVRGTVSIGAECSRSFLQVCSLNHIMTISTTTTTIS